VLKEDSIKNDVCAYISESDICILVEKYLCNSYNTGSAIYDYGSICIYGKDSL